MPCFLHKKNIPLFLVVCLILISISSNSFAATADNYLLKGINEFRELTNNTNKAKYRANWEAVAKNFTTIIKRYPKNAAVPKAYYYLGRTYEELAKRSLSRNDNVIAVDKFLTVVEHYPLHDFADEALFRAAYLRYTKLGQKTDARRNLSRLVGEYKNNTSVHKQAVEILNTWGGPINYIVPETARRTQISGKTLTHYTEKPSYSLPNGKAEITDLTYKSSDEYTRITLTLSKESKYRYQLLSPDPSAGHPHRLYIDIENAQLSPKIAPRTEVFDGILRSVRAAQNSSKTTRIVLDFSSLREYKVFNFANPDRIIIDVFSPKKITPYTSYAQNPQTNERERRQESQPPKNMTQNTAQNMRDRATLINKDMASDLIRQLGLTVETVMIDPGHGGRDPGASYFGIKEKDLNLAAAKLLGSYLKDLGFNVIYTRTTDIFLSLDKRTALANTEKADIFISLHCNAHKNSNINGLETYSLNLAKDSDAIRIAARENAVDAKKISDLQFILSDLMLSSKIQESTDLAIFIQKRSLQSVQSNWKVKNGGTREAPFYVLMGAKMPAVLVEMGYLSNRSEINRLNSNKYLKRLMQGLANGILAYKKTIEQFAP